jgi:hypothetical protein
MGSGQYLSSKSVHQLNKLDTVKVPIVSGLIMFCAYFLAGLVPALNDYRLLRLAMPENAAIVAALFFLTYTWICQGQDCKSFTTQERA